MPTDTSKQPPTRPIQIRFPPNDVEWLRRYAAGNNRTMAQELRHWVRARRMRAERDA